MWVKRGLLVWQLAFHNLKSSSTVIINQPNVAAFDHIKNGTKLIDFNGGSVHGEKL